MCRDQNLISETDERTYVRTNVRMKIEKPVLGRPFLGPAKINELNCLLAFLLHEGQLNCPVSVSDLALSVTMSGVCRNRKLTMYAL